MFVEWYSDPERKAELLAKMVVSGWDFNDAIEMLEKLTGSPSYDEALFKEEQAEQQLKLLEVATLPELLSELESVADSAAKKEEWLAAAIATSTLTLVISGLTGNASERLTNLPSYDEASAEQLLILLGDRMLPDLADQFRGELSYSSMKGQWLAAAIAASMLAILMGSGSQRVKGGAVTPPFLDCPEVRHESHIPD